MRNSRLITFATVIATGFAIAAPTLAQAQQEFPTKPIRFMVGFVAGGSADTTARVIAQKLADAWGRPVIVDNRTGASGTIAVDLTAKAAPDGYTIGVISATHTINSVVNPKLPYDLTQDLAAISQVSSHFFVVYVSSSVPVKSIKELIAYAKANPGKLNYATPGSGSFSHLAVEMFSHMTGARLVHVPYKGGPAAIAAALAGDVQIGVAVLVSLRPHMSAGRIRLLAITAKQRSPAVPELPTVAEAGVPGYEVNPWNGVVTGAKVSPAIIRKLNLGIAEALKSPDVVQRLGADGSTLVGSSPEEFGVAIKSEIAKWRKLVKDAGLVLN